MALRQLLRKQEVTSTAKVYLLTLDQFRANLIIVLGNYAIMITH